MNGTGDCYIVAFNLVMSNEGYKLCHGMVTNPETGERHAHAWVEHVEVIKLPDERPPGFEHLRDMHLDMVLDQANGNNADLPRAWYYKVGVIDPDEVVRYTADEARRHALKTNHFGPWHEGEGDDE